MSTASIGGLRLRSRDALLPSRPVSEPTSIRNLMGDYGGQIDLRPLYQRDIRWKKDAMCQLIHTVMTEGLIPGLILYRLQGEERIAESPIRYEMVDGQHRFFSIQKFFNSEVVTEAGGKGFMITWIYRDASTGRDTHVFCKETDATKEWIAQNRSLSFAYMTEEEKDAFCSFKVDIKEIKDPLSLDQRRAIFVKLQQGVSVRGSDLLKNMVDVSLVRFIVEEARWESDMKDVLAARCWMNPKNYWLHWVIRFYFLLNPGMDSTQESMFAKRDSEITKLIKDGSPSLEADEEEQEHLREKVKRFFAFLDSLPAGVKLPPIHFYALFAHLAESEAGREDILRGHINDWANSRQMKRWKKAWENRKTGGDDEERATAFFAFKNELALIRIPVREPEARTSIPKKLRLKLWSNSFGGEEESGFCFCCGEDISYEGNYEACHIVAHKHGGSDTLDNLAPGCRSCNRSMGTQDLREFKKQFYTDVKTPLDDM